MMRFACLFFSCFFIFPGLGFSTGSFYIKGRIIAQPTDTAWWHTIYLAKMTTIDDFFTSSPQLIVDSAMVRSDGRFEFRNAKAIENNTFYRLETVTKGNAGHSMLVMGGISENYTYLLLNAHSKIEFTTQFGRIGYALKPIKMDAANLAMRHVYNLGRTTNELTEKVITRLRSLEENPATPPDTLKKLRARSSELIAAHTKYMQPVIDTISNPYVSLWAFMTNFSDDSSFCIKMNSRYQREIPQSKYAGQFLDIVYDILYTLPIGSQAPQISLPDTSGRLVTLASLKGKYVFIDFWASWCHPCRMENQEIVRPLYNKYASRNFAVLSISMDTKADLWKNAIKKDQLTWLEVCDLKGISSPAARQYKVTDVPVTYVIGPSGTILAKNLHNKELEDFIDKKMLAK